MKGESFKISVAQRSVFRKWDVVQINSVGRKQIVIRCEMDSNGEKLTLKNIPNFKWKLFFWVWFKVLKIRVWIADQIRKITEPKNNV